VLLERMFGELNERQEEYVRDIRDSGRHLLELINEILDLSKVEAGRMELEPAALSLPDMLEQALALVRERAARQRLAVTLDVDAAVGIVWADETKLKQVVVNLLTNAVKFTPEGGRVDVAARSRDAEVQVTVRDTGVGIAAEDQARIFEAFQRGDRRASAEGTGLGLTLSKRFVELHGGRIWVESRPGEGSTFGFAIPLSPLQTLLVVGDERRAAELLEPHVDGERHRLVFAADRAQGLELARTLRPRAVIIDGPDDVDLLAQLEEDPATAGIPVVIVSMNDERGAIALLEALAGVL
jgi:signal transduction histidine kinase